MGWGPPGGPPPGGGPPGYGAPPQGRPPPAHPAVIPPHPILFLENLPEDATTEQIATVFAPVLLLSFFASLSASMCLLHLVSVQVTIALPRPNPCAPRPMKV